MNRERRLLILSCSQRKHTSHEPLPAIERYNGPLFFVLRRFLRECPPQARPLDVHIISAAYGLIRRDFPTPRYDRKMDMPRAVELQPQVNTTFSDITRGDYESICFAMGKTYLKAFENALELVPGDTELVITHGRIGEQQGATERLAVERFHILVSAGILMKLEVIKSSENAIVETYLVADISTSIFSDWEESSQIIAFNELSRIVTNLDAGDAEMNVAPRVDFYLPNPLKDRMLAQFAELHSDSQELSDQPADGLNEGPYLKLSTVLSAVITEISRNHQPHTDYQVRISDE